LNRYIFSIIPSLFVNNRNE